MSSSFDTEFDDNMDSMRNTILTVAIIGSVATVAVVVIVCCMCKRTVESVANHQGASRLLNAESDVSRLLNNNSTSACISPLLFAGHTQNQQHLPVHDPHMQYVVQQQGNGVNYVQPVYNPSQPPYMQDQSAYYPPQSGYNPAAHGPYNPAPPAPHHPAPEDCAGSNPAGNPGASHSVV